MSRRFIRRTSPVGPFEIAILAGIGLLAGISNAIVGGGSGGRLRRRCWREAFGKAVEECVRHLLGGGIDQPGAELRDLAADLGLSRRRKNSEPRPTCCAVRGEWVVATTCMCGSLCDRKS